MKTDLHIRRPEFLRLPAGFRKPFQLTETTGFADYYLKISRSYSSGNLNYSNFPPCEADWSVMMPCTIEITQCNGKHPEWNYTIREAVYTHCVECAVLYVLNSRWRSFQMVAPQLSIELAFVLLNRHLKSTHAMPVISRCKLALLCFAWHTVAQRGSYNTKLSQ